MCSHLCEHDRLNQHIYQRLLCTTLGGVWRLILQWADLLPVYTDMGLRFRECLLLHLWSQHHNSYEQYLYNIHEHSDSKHYTTYNHQYTDQRDLCNAIR
jgi:hypothetical protein